MTVPAEVLLAFIDQTGANPIWLLTGEGQHLRRDNEVANLAELSPIQLIRRGLEKLEQQPTEVVAPADPQNAETSSDFVAVSLVPIAELSAALPNQDRVEGHILAYRDWLPHPKETVAVRLDDAAMFPILPAGSVVAVDRSLTDPQRLQGKMVAAMPDKVPIIRWLDLSGRHLIFRPNQQSREHPLIPLEYDSDQPSTILGQVVWSWSCFNDLDEVPKRSS